MLSEGQGNDIDTVSEDSSGLIAPSPTPCELPPSAGPLRTILGTRAELMLAL